MLHFFNNIKFSVVNAVMCGPDVLPKLSSLFLQLMLVWADGSQPSPSSGHILSQTHPDGPHPQEQSQTNDSCMGQYKGQAPWPHTVTTSEGSCQNSPWGCPSPALQLPPAHSWFLQPVQFPDYLPSKPSAHKSQIDASLDLTYDTFIASSTGEVFLFHSISFIFGFQPLPQQSYIYHF